MRLSEERTISVRATSLRPTAVPVRFNSPSLCAAEPRPLARMPCPLARMLRRLPSHLQSVRLPKSAQCGAAYCRRSWYEQLHTWCRVDVNFHLSGAHVQEHNPWALRRFGSPRHCIRTAISELNAFATISRILYANCSAKIKC